MNTTKEKPVFEIDYEPDQPMKEHPFYGWLNENYSRKEHTDLYYIKKFLEDIGYTVGRDKLEQEQLDTLSYVLQYYHQHWTPSQQVFTITQLFQPPRSFEEGFYIVGIDSLDDSIHCLKLPSSTKATLRPPMICWYLIYKPPLITPK